MFVKTVALAGFFCCFSYENSQLSTCEISVDFDGGKETPRPVWRIIVGELTSRMKRTLSVYSGLQSDGRKVVWLKLKLRHACTLYFQTRPWALRLKRQRNSMDCESLSLNTTSYFNIFHSKFYTFKRVEKTLKFSW